MAANRLKQITTQAKKLYKTGKYKRWTDAIKAASKLVTPGKKKKVGAVKILQKGESKNAKVTKVLQQTRTKKGQFKGYKRVGDVYVTYPSKKDAEYKVQRNKKGQFRYVDRVAGTHKDNKSHNVNIRVVSGVGNAPQYQDVIAARDISLYADSDSRLYFSRKLPILKNLQRKYKKGTYDVENAAKLWMNFIVDAMQRYNKEFGSRGDKWHELLSVSDRKLLAREYAIDTLNEFKMGNFIVD